MVKGVVMDSIKFSVIIPVYNVENYLKQCIDSVLSQNYDNYEIVLINDGSTDHSFDICEYYKANDNRIVLLNQNNKGAAAARNNGIKHATGDYLLFLDSDDYWLVNNVFRIIYDRINKFNSDVIIFNYKKIFNNNSSIYFSSSYDMPTEFLGKNSKEHIFTNELWTSGAWNKAINRSLFDDDLLFRTGITSEDIDWCARLAIKCNSFDYITTPLVGYRYRGESVSNALSLSKINDLKNNISKTYDIISETNSDELLSYLSYQFATFCFNISKLKPINRKDFISFINNYVFLLQYSNNKKVRLLQYSIKFFGIKCTLKFLHCIFR